MKRTFLFSVLGVLSVVTYLSCSKETLHQAKQTVSNDALARFTPLVLNHDSLVMDSLKKKYSLVVMTNLPAGFRPLNVTTTAQGSAFFDNVAIQKAATKTFTGYVNGSSSAKMSKDSSNNVLVGLPSAQSAAGDLNDGTITLIIDFGNWSELNITFTYQKKADGTYVVSNVSEYVTGFVFGISYTQTSYTINPTTGQVGFTLNGTVNAGLTVGGGSVVVGYSYGYNYKVVFSPFTTAYTVKEGLGH